MAGRYRLSQDVPQPLDLSTLGSGAAWLDHGRESRRILVRVKKTPPPAAAAGISRFRSKCGDNIKLPQFLEILWHVESIGISPAQASENTAQYGRNLRWARISAILCLSSSNFFLNWAMSETGKKRTGHTRAADFPLLRSFTSTHQEGLSPNTRKHALPRAGPFAPGLSAKLGLWLFISSSAAAPSWGANRPVFPSNCCLCAD